MIRKYLSFAFVFASFLTSSVAFAEEPYVGIGAVQHRYEQDLTEAEPISYRITVGSRISKHTVIEAFYLGSAIEDDEATAGPSATPIDFEYDFIVGASINGSVKAGPFTLYAGPNITATKINVVATGPDPILNAAINAANDLDTRVSGGLGIGLDLRFARHFSLDFNAQSYYFSDDAKGAGAGAELRYHF